MLSCSLFHKTRPLEDYPSIAGYESPNRAGALRTDLDWLIAHLLEAGKAVPAGFTLIFVSRHNSEPPGFSVGRERQNPLPPLEPHLASFSTSSSEMRF
jgi:hypothetical protein